MSLLTLAIAVVLPILASAVSVLLVFGGALAVLVLLQALVALADAPRPGGLATAA